MTRKTMLILGLIAGLGGSDIIIDQAFAQQPKNNVQDQITDLDERVSILEVWKIDIDSVIQFFNSKILELETLVADNYADFLSYRTNTEQRILDLDQMVSDNRQLADLNTIRNDQQDELLSGLEQIQLDLLSIWDEIGSIHSTNNQQSQKLSEYDDRLQTLEEIDTTEPTPDSANWHGEYWGDYRLKCNISDEEIAITSLEIEHYTDTVELLRYDILSESIPLSGAVQIEESGNTADTIEVIIPTEWINDYGTYEELYLSLDKIRNPEGQFLVVSATGTLYYDNTNLNIIEVCIPDVYPAVFDKIS